MLPLEATSWLPVVTAASFGQRRCREAQSPGHSGDTGPGWGRALAGLGLSGSPLPSSRIRSPAFSATLPGWCPWLCPAPGTERSHSSGLAPNTLGQGAANTPKSQRRSPVVCLSCWGTRAPGPAALPGNLGKWRKGGRPGASAHQDWAGGARPRARRAGGWWPGPSTECGRGGRGSAGHGRRNGSRR